MDSNNPSTEALALAYHSLTESDTEIMVADNELHERITERVVELLTKNPERLMSILYRIDVNEQRINDVMKNAPIGGIASRISELIIERMQQKVETRNKYRSANQPDSENTD
ncbi:MAG: hypothetical protein U0Y96_03840 [Candidatus Kapaibacterium sp.]|nr:hypothetical protein [Bacteroidota bacterium]